MTRASATVATLLLSAALAGCGGDTPAVCSSVDNLQSSVNDIKDIDVTSSGGVSDLQSGLTSVETELLQVKADAQSEFSSQIGDVDAALRTLKTSVRAAQSKLSTATLAVARGSLSTFNTALQTLISDVKANC